MQIIIIIIILKEIIDSNNNMVGGQALIEGAAQSHKKNLRYLLADWVMIKQKRQLVIFSKIIKLASLALDY